MAIDIHSTTLQSMVKKDEEEATAAKARLWSSEAEVDRLRMSSHATPLTHG